MAVEESIEATQTRIESIQQQKISGESIYKILLYFDKMYDKFTDLQKKEFMKSFIDEVQINEEPKENGQILKHIKFKFPVYFNGNEVWGIGWDNESTVDTVIQFGMMVFCGSSKPVYSFEVSFTPAKKNMGGGSRA